MNLKPFKHVKKEVVTSAGVTHEFVYKFYQGMTSSVGVYRHIERSVEFKAFALQITERISYEGEVIKEKEHDYGFVCARSAAVAYALARLPKCESIEAIDEFLSDFMVDSLVAMTKDANKALRKLLGLTLSSNAVVRTHKPATPRPEIILPWITE